MKDRNHSGRSFGGLPVLEHSISNSESQWRKAVFTINATRRFRYAGSTPGLTSKRSAPKHIEYSSSSKKSLLSPSEVDLNMNKDVPVENGPNGFGVTKDELVQLLELPHDIMRLQKLGGVSRVVRCLGVSTEMGLPSQEVDAAANEKRALAFDRNVYPEQPSKPFWQYCWEASQDPTLFILLLCAVAALATGIAIEGAEEGWYDGAGIGFAIVLVVLVTAVNDYRQDLQFRDLDAKNKDLRVNVLRSGLKEELSIYDLLVGDIVMLATGDQISADGLVVSAQSMTLDESTMTGESDHLKKNPDTAPFLLSGTKVADGYGVMIVTGVGENTEWGRLMGSGEDPEEAKGKLQKLEELKAEGKVDDEEYQSQKEVLQLELELSGETPLQVRLNGLATTIGKLGLFVAVLVLLVLVIRFLVEEQYDEGGTQTARTLVEYFAIAVTIVVVAVPEGLPLAVTLSLAYSMKQMMADNALVRHLAACETMGGATNICSDKTGTLTTNKMTVVKAFLCGLKRDSEDLEANLTAKKLPPFGLSLVFEGLFANAEGEVFTRDQTGRMLKEPIITGKPTEVALLDYGIRLGSSPEQAVKQPGLKVIRVDPFNSTKKRMGAVVKLPDGTLRVHVKGASEIVLGLCSRRMQPDGTVSKMKEQDRKEVADLIHEFAEGSLRTIALGYIDLPPGTEEGPIVAGDVELPDQGLCCLGVVGIKDPCRPGVPDAVARCQRAGIMVRMVTGDNITTACAIARECNILSPGGLAVEGVDFRKMTFAERRARFGDRLEKLQVMARSSPSDKYDLVHMLRGLGEVVGVTGDGTNDSKALKEADIGLAMGIAGTEVAKKSSDIVILDDNFTSIVTVVRWGRSVYSNIQKFVQFQVTVNLVALSLNFISAVGQGTAPLTAVQLLWVNLIMDTMGALALGTEPPREELMQQKPYGRTSPLITKVMWRNILGQFAFQLVLLVVYTFEGYKIFGLDEITGECDNPVGERDSTMCNDWHTFDEHEQGLEHNTLTLHTIIFNTFVFCQVFNELNARHMDKLNVFEGLLANRVFIFIILITCGFQVLLIETPLSDFASTTSLSTKHWLICVGVGAISIPLAVLVKLIPIPEMDNFQKTRLAKLMRVRTGGTESLVPAAELQETQRYLDIEKAKNAELEKKLSYATGKLKEMESSSKS
eukprot:CAMPEP_0196599016 /NCGR_PEP_ID=MMETSP1081-20130531/94632_1 /TAXON_ID=36882 /ORGANISM="Pyramimonas amylifera, Strain CCMP720" /LENGTH=1165 /DNA_ID=CAMNT_0041924757 /DNA_START=173 /DNA_END=3670 /DNA_ORIENTATION=-